MMNFGGLRLTVVRLRDRPARSPTSGGTACSVCPRRRTSQYWPATLGAAVRGEAWQWFSVTRAGLVVALASAAPAAARHRRALTDFARLPGSRLPAGDLLVAEAATAEHRSRPWSTVSALHGGWPGLAHGRGAIRAVLGAGDGRAGLCVIGNGDISLLGAAPQRIEPHAGVAAVQRHSAVDFATGDAPRSARPPAARTRRWPRRRKFLWNGANRCGCRARHFPDHAEPRRTSR